MSPVAIFILRIALLAAAVVLLYSYQLKAARESHPALRMIGTSALLGLIFSHLLPSLVH